MKDIFKPKILDSLSTYSWKGLKEDVIAGLILGIVALPLAIAFAIASGVSPEQGLVTAIIAGFLISALGGSRVQIGGPTGAFIVIVYGIVQEFGISGLIIATFIAGIILIIMGLSRLGNLIKFIPHSLIIGFTSGIAVIIFSSQIKDLLGLEMGEVPVDFLEKWKTYFLHFDRVNFMAIAVALFSIMVILTFPLISKKVPGSLIAIVLSTLAVQLLGLPVETIGSRFGTISAALPAPNFPAVNFGTFKALLGPALTIAMLGAIESLLSAAVADGMTGGNHRSNTELIGQGIANMGSAVFGGIPATGAIARTATNVRNGGKTPIAGIVHALVLLLILIFLGTWAAWIPLSCLAAVLVVISINMSEYLSFWTILKGPRGDVAVLLVTFLLTVFVDLTVAIPVGIILASFSFIQKMIASSHIRFFETHEKESDYKDELLNRNFTIPQGVTTFEIIGPLFFGATYKVREAMRTIEKRPEVLIVRMHRVEVIDASGIHSFQQMVKDFEKKGTKILISELYNPEVSKQLLLSDILPMVGKENIYHTYADALRRADEIIRLKKRNLA